KEASPAALRFLFQGQSRAPDLKRDPLQSLSREVLLRRRRTFFAPGSKDAGIRDRLLEGRSPPQELGRSSPGRAAPNAALSTDAGSDPEVLPVSRRSSSALFR